MPAMTDSERLTRFHAACRKLGIDQEVLPEGFIWRNSEYSNEGWGIVYERSGSKQNVGLEPAIRIVCHGLLEVAGRREEWKQPRILYGGNDRVGWFWTADVDSDDDSHHHPTLADACLCLAEELAKRHGEPKCTCPVCSLKPRDPTCPVHAKPEQQVRRAHSGAWETVDQSADGGSSIYCVVRELADRVAALETKDGG